MLYTCICRHTCSAHRDERRSLLLLSLDALTVETSKYIALHFTTQAISHIDTVVFHVVLPVTVFIVNMIVVREVGPLHRASNSADVNLGRQQHHQSTLSNSVVPTVMLITTSLTYVLLIALWNILWVFITEMPDSAGQTDDRTCTQ